MADYANSKRTRTPSTLKVVDVVLLQNNSRLKNKMEPAYFSHKLIVSNKKGSMITACGGGKQITRNSSFFRQFDCGDPATFTDEEVPATARGKNSQAEADLHQEKEREESGSSSSGSLSPLDEAIEPPSEPVDPLEENEENLHGWMNADNVPPLASDEDDDQQETAIPQRRGARPKKRPDPLHYIGKGIQGKKKY